MLSFVNVVIYAMIVLIAIILVVLILIQPSKGGGLGSAFGGMGENVLGAHAMEHLSKLTVWLISIFFVLALLLTILSAHAKRSDNSIMGDEPAAPAAAEKTVEKTAPAAAAPVAAAPVKAAADQKPAAVPEKK